MTDLKQSIHSVVADALEDLRVRDGLPSDLPPIVIERTRDRAHGDFASPIAMALARAARRKPRDIAEDLVALMDAGGGTGTRLIDSVDIAGPGFINFKLANSAFQDLVPVISDADGRFGLSSKYAGTRVQIEFVSANPTGPLHVGHGRGAAYGATVADIMAAVGFDVHREYYVNDAGRQMDILGLSVWLRYLDRLQALSHFPQNAYQGDYVREIADALSARDGERWTVNEELLEANAAEVDERDPERFVDAKIALMREALGAKAAREVVEFALGTILDEMRDDLDQFGVRFEEWFSERSLSEGAIARALDELNSAGHTYREGGAVWFRSTSFGDEKDRVLVRENGQTTYFASDVAYHLNKFDRGFDRVINIWGADHHGYISRVKGSLEAMGRDPERLEILLVQFANLFRGSERLAMSTRSGEFVTLRALMDEVGKDAARFFYILRKSDQHLDFDLELATSQSNDNPVYYIQYAHARICSVERQLDERGFAIAANDAHENRHRLVETEEIELLSTLGRYPEVLESAALTREPHQIAYFLRDLATEFHAYYNAHQFIVDDASLRAARFGLCRATKLVLSGGLELLGVSAPETM